jgi:hypothetical protein
MKNSPKSRGNDFGLFLFGAAVTKRCVLAENFEIYYIYYI